MKRNKYEYLGLILICVAVVQYNYHLDEYVLLLLVVVPIALLWEFLDQKNLNVHRRENIELQEEIKSTAKDTHLKNKQLLTVVTSIPFPMLLVGQFDNIVIHNNVSELCEDGPVDERMTYTGNAYLRPVRESIKDAFILEKPTGKIIDINGVEYQSISVPMTIRKKYSDCLVLFQDISKTLEGKKMQKRFITDASHELKAPATVIKGMVGILNREDFNDEETCRESTDQIEQEINRLDILVKDLLQLSRLSLPTVLLEREKTNLCLVIDKAVKSLEKKAEKKGLRIVREYQNHDLVFCDSLKMSQIVLNLLSNAIKYSDRDTITLETREEGPWYVLQVRDEGHGIVAEDLEKIFDRFYRMGDDRSRSSDGLGLGLSIVKSIIEAHHGEIKVESESDKGTTFTVGLKN